MVELANSVAGAVVPRLRWLHLTDLHIGRDNESQTVAIKSLVSAIQTYAAARPFDVVILSGDLANAGQLEEYEKFATLVLEPLKATTLCANAVFIAAPGNHDLDCDATLPVVWSTLDGNRQEQFFQLSESGRKVRSYAPCGHFRLTERTVLGDCRPVWTIRQGEWHHSQDRDCQAPQ